MMSGAWRRSALALALCGLLQAASAQALDPVTPAELGEIRAAFQGIGLRGAELAVGEDGRVTLVGEYENREAVETAFAAARSVVGLRRVAPTTPSNIRYRLKGFNAAFATTLGKMMQKPQTSPTPPLPAPVMPQPQAQAPSQDTRAPRTLALVIGASKYKYLPPENALDGADKDATDIHQFLLARDGAGLAPESVRLLTREQATSVAVKAAMQDLVVRTRPGDTVVLFVAAHGLPNAMNKFDIVLYDTEFPRKTVNGKEGAFEFVIANRQTALADDDLQGFIARLTERNVRSVVVLDTCYSGKTFVAVPGYLPSRTRSLRQHRQEVEYTASPSQEAMTDIVQKAKDMPTSRIVIVSASENEESIEAPSLGGGAFTQTYIRTLRAERDFANAFDQAKPSVIRIARTLGMSQTPRMLVVPEAADTRM